jgi:predicted extracellular nuclease
MALTFRVMTWNLENLYPVGSEYGPETQQDFDQKPANIASVIGQQKPDVLAVQEIGTESTFTALKAALGIDYVDKALSRYPDGRGIRVGFLSRYDLTDIQDFSAFPGGALRGAPAVGGQSLAALSRGALRARVKPSDGIEITLVTAHLKSKLLGFPGDRRSAYSEDEWAWAAGMALIQRSAEAVALRQYADWLTRRKENRFVLLGDFNDAPEAATSQILAGPPAAYPDTRLYNLVSLIPEERRFSRVYEGLGEMIDHILVSRELFSNELPTPVVDSLIETIGGAPGGQPLVSVTDDPTERRNKTWPDHAPVMATFEI